MTAQPHPPVEEQTPGDGPPGEPSKPKKAVAVAKTWIDAMLGQWGQLLAAAGAVGVALVGYDLAKELGDGSPDGADQLWTIVSIVAFALGAALLLVLPITLRATTRASLASAIAEEQARRNWWRRPLRHNQPVVGPDLLHGYGTVESFQRAMVEALEESRGAWDQGLAIDHGLYRRIDNYVTQRRQAEAHVAAEQVRRASFRATWLAVVGLTLAVFGYANASYLTSQAIRNATVEDAATEARTAREALVLEDALADSAAPRPVLPVVPSEVKVVFPDEASAVAAFGGDADDLPTDCWEAGRDGRAYQFVDPTVGGDTIVLVLLEAISTACPAVVIEAAPSWLEARDIEVPEPESEAPEESGQPSDAGDGDASTTTTTVGTTTRTSGA